MAHQEPKWPYAQVTYNMYNDVVNSLNAQRAAINSAATAVVPTSGFTGGALTGDYYDKYEAHVTMWIQEAQGLQAEFAAFLSELDRRIAKAQAEASFWYSRIGVMKTVPDSDD